MKSLNFETRSQLARECINRVCEAAGLKASERGRIAERSVSRHIASAPRMEHAGSNVSLTVSSSSLTLVNLESGQRIATHDMPRVSFASGGDTVSEPPHLPGFPPVASVDRPRVAGHARLCGVRGQGSERVASLLRGRVRWGSGPRRHLHHRPGLRATLQAAPEQTASVSACHPLPIAACPFTFYSIVSSG